MGILAQCPISFQVKAVPFRLKVRAKLLRDLLRPRTTAGGVRKIHPLACGGRQDKPPSAGAEGGLRLDHSSGTPSRKEGRYVSRGL